MATQPTAPTPPAGRAQADGPGRAQPLRVDVVTIFPGMFEPFLRESFVRLAREKDRLAVEVHDLRDWTRDRHRTVDDAPYGGGPGMVMKPEPLVTAAEELAGPKGPERRARVVLLTPQGRRLDQAGLEALAAEELAGPKGPERRARVVLLTPQGRRLDQAGLEALAAEEHLVLLCGRYEGVDQRVVEVAVDDEVSLGDYVLSGGEVPAMAVIEGVARLLPDVLGNPESAVSESFQEALLEGPQYTRPAVFRGLPVPEVLRSGDHAAVARWRREQAEALTRTRRPDLLPAADAPPPSGAGPRARGADPHSRKDPR